MSERRITERGGFGTYTATLEKDDPMDRMKYYALLIMVLCIMTGSPAFAQFFEGGTPEDSLDNAFFYIRFQQNYARAAWLFDGVTNEIIGYAPWDALSKRWTLFTLTNRYSGFLQATIGTTSPPHYKQYLWYDKENRYKGLFVARLGGRPVSPNLPFGELGGERDLYIRGSIPLPLPEYEVETDPLRTFPSGVDVSPIERPVRSYK